MSQVKYVGEEHLVIPSVSLEVAPGDLLDLTALGIDNPNPALFVDAEPAKKTKAADDAPSPA